MSKNFKEFADKTFQFFLDNDPVHAASIGLHQYDGIISDFSLESIESLRKEYQKVYDELLSFDTSNLSDEEALEYQFIKWILESNFFEHDDLQSYKTNPMYYAYVMGNVGGYISREYAPFEARLKSIISLVEKLPAIYEDARENLNEVCAALHCKYAINFTQGFVKFFKDDLPAELAKRNISKELAYDYNAASEKGIEALQGYINFIEEKLLPIADNEHSFRLGKDKFEKMFKVKEQVELPIEKIKKLGEMELARLKKEYDEHLAKNPGLDPRSLEAEHPTEESLVADTKGTLNELIEFVKEKKLIEFPDKMNCIVTEMPKYMAFGFAAMDTAGPFEKSDESYYYVNLPEKEWDEKKKNEWMSLFAYPTLKMISIHEAFPGHYTHFLYSNKYANRFAKISMSYTYVEGWAHYTEEMMADAGYDAHDPKMKLAQILEAQIRCCRYLVAIGLHAENMSIDDATDFFMKNAHMPETTARQEAERGAFDPGYLSYTLGKIYLKKLKQMFFEKHPDKPLSEFHQRIVSMGCPTYKMAEKYILA